MRWLEAAQCRDLDPELFFPISVSQAEAARSVCRTCQVHDDCLTMALETGQDAGVWGGLTADERRAMRRRKAPSPTAAGAAAR